MSGKTGGCTKKRGVWSKEEVLFFISLIKDKHVLGLMDGKRPRIRDIFKTLVAPMNHAGFARDVAQLTIKYKNLKAEYYKCKRQNATNANSPHSFEYYTEMDELLGSRQTSQTLSFESVINSSQRLEGLCSEHMIDVKEIYEDMPDADGEVPGPSSSTSRSPSTSRSTNEDAPLSEAKKRKDYFNQIMELCENARAAEAEADRQFLETFLEKQEKILMKCTHTLLNGMKSLFQQMDNNSHSN